MRVSRWGIRIFVGMTGERSFLMMVDENRQEMALSIKDIQMLWHFEKI